MKLKWNRDNLGYLCPHCGTPNPDNGDKCGNCERNPFELPKENELLTAEGLATLRAAPSRSKS